MNNHYTYMGHSSAHLTQNKRVEDNFEVFQMRCFERYTNKSLTENRSNEQMNVNASKKLKQNDYTIMKSIIKDL